MAFVCAAFRDVMMNLISRFKKSIRPFLLMTSLVWPVVSLAQTDAEKKQLIEKMIVDFSPDFHVPEIDVATAKRLLSEGEFLFLDVRDTKEIAISTIPNAITKQQFEANPEVYKNRKIVAYCTIGYRSSKYAERWNKKGFHISNLRGSLLLWTHANGALVDQDGQPTHLVHTYGKQWNLVPNSYQSVF
jgi:sodium/bile acid cotransporter 7